MERIELKQIILDQNQERVQNSLVERDVFRTLEKYAGNSFIIIISGIRRSGKSTLLSQIRAKYPGYYLDFDDERLTHFKLEDFQLLYEVFLELYGEKQYFYFDEIQNVPAWERFVRRLHDSGKKIFVTGSNASLLSKELGTRLTGRYLDITIFPFSFKEFLAFRSISYEDGERHTTEKKAVLRRAFGEYLVQGGMPEYLKTNDVDYLKNVYNNILYSDILVRYSLPNERALKDIVNLATNSIAKQISFNSFKKAAGLGSSTTVKDYFVYLENSFLIFLVPRFEYSLKKQMYAPKKVYVIDTAIAIHLGYRISKDSGRLLENIVFLELRRRKKDIYYSADKKECDFVIKEGITITEAIQVCYDFNDENRERELEGLSETMTKFKLKKGLILTEDQEDELKVNGKKVHVLPVWKWLLQESHTTQIA